MDVNEYLSPVAVSCLWTMGLAAAYDPRQRVPGHYTIPDAPVRLLRAQLVLEEALETVRALGFVPMLRGPDGGYDPVSFEDLKWESRGNADLELIIDGCCDTVYVAAGTLCAVGAADAPHLAEVCRANEAKFPGGQVIVGTTGKFQKPPDWIGPNHHRAAPAGVDLAAIQRKILEDGVVTRSRP